MNSNMKLLTCVFLCCAFLLRGCVCHCGSSSCSGSGSGSCSGSSSGSSSGSCSCSGSCSGSSSSSGSGSCSGAGSKSGCGSGSGHDPSKLGSVSILDSGIMKFHRGDQGIIFYVTVKGAGGEAVPVSARMIQCCERHHDDTDCESMQLVGGNFGKISPGQVRNLTLVFPNLYLHNRKGECLVAVHTNGQETTQSIPFDTMIDFKTVPPILQGYYDVKKVKRCCSLDQDPLEGCYPVNCQMKYSGRRNYYHNTMKRCQPVPVCNSDPHKSTPDVAYVPISNECRDLGKCITDEDIRFLTHGTIDSDWQNYPIPHLQNMRCHHGHLDNETGFCICDEGWTSGNFNCDFTAGTGVYHMCNIEIRPWTATMYWRYWENIALMCISSVIFAMLLVCLSFCLHWFWRFFILNYESLRFQKALFRDYPDSDYLINCLSEGESCPTEED